jgi:hypothetical protein
MVDVVAVSGGCGGGGGSPFASVARWWVVVEVEVVRLRPTCVCAREVMVGWAVSPPARVCAREVVKMLVVVVSYG